MSNETTQQANGFTLEQVIDRYLAVKDEVELIEADTKAKLEPLKKAMTAIETYLMAVSNQTGQTQFGTTNATAFQTTKTNCGVADFEATKRFMLHDAIEAVVRRVGYPDIPPGLLEECLDIALEKGAWQLLNKAVNKTTVKEHMDQHDGVPPPGVKWESFKAIQVRSKKGSKQQEIIE